MKIDWKLYSDKKLLVCRQNVDAYYCLDKYIIYEHGNEHNKFDIILNTFFRKTDEIDMSIDFNKKLCSFDFKDIGKCKFDIKCKSVIKNSSIKLIYEIDEEEKVIEIIIK